MFSLRSPLWDAVDYWALDLETSGLDPHHDLILSAGLVPIRRGAIHWGERFYSLVRPPSGQVPGEAAIRIHHILPRELQAAPTIDQVLPEILDRLTDGVLLVHYARLDLGFLRRACRSQARRWPRPRIVDTVRLLSRLGHRRRQIEPHAESLPADLGEARRALGLPAHLRHHALYDALATAELFLAVRRALGASRLGQLT
jgi:DNA polymerase-3 subunit epsilon